MARISIPDGIEQTDRLLAAVDVVGRSGATNLNAGIFNENDSDWYAEVEFGDKILGVEHYPSVEDALDALAKRLLTGGQCAHCGGLVALSPIGAVFYPNAKMADGREFTLEDAMSKPQCHWRREGPLWVKGCE
jgi:hypothetical protein